MLNFRSFPIWGLGGLMAEVTEGPSNSTCDHERALGGGVGGYAELGRATHKVGGRALAAGPACAKLNEGQVKP